MKIFNTESGVKEEFISLEEGGVKMYVCGPTVYDIPHLGHGRSAVSFDLMRRYFLYKGCSVVFVSNYTDIDDKMINRALEEGLTVKELSEKIIPEYEKDYGVLGVLKPDFQPRATEYIGEMVDIIKKLEEKGHIYVLDDGVYFDVDSYKAYGEFSGQRLEDLRMGARVEVKETKKNPYDFALWKFKKEGEPSWPTPWGEGRPGWHIECSAMSYAKLGEKFDIHGGGLDLVFPHHECEVAQSKGAFGMDSFAKYWLHNGFINVDNEKMSKSLGNFSTLRDIFEKYNPKVVRLMFLQTHYRNPINFSEVLLEQAKAALGKLHNFVRNLRVGYEELSDGEGKMDLGYGDKMLEQFEFYMDDDFNTSGALGAVFNLVGVIGGLRSLEKLTKAQVDRVEKALKKVDGVLGVIFPDEEVIEEDIQILIDKRNEARASRNFELADNIRDELKAKGVELEDTPSGVIWKKI